MRGGSVGIGVVTVFGAVVVTLTATVVGVPGAVVTGAVVGLLVICGIGVVTVFGAVVATLRVVGGNAAFF